MIALATAAARAQQAEGLQIARDVTAAADPLATWIVALTAAAALAACLFVIWRAQRSAPFLLPGGHEGKCLDPGCGRDLLPVHSTRCRVLFCPAGHCWVERRRRFAVDVYRYRSGDCPYPHAHHAACTDLEEDPAVG